jgi:hypothetical protein
MSFHHSAACSYISRGMGSKAVDCRSSETYSHPIDMIKGPRILHDDQVHPYQYSRSACFQTIVLWAWNFTNVCGINTLRMSSFHTTICGQTKQVLRLTVCSTSTTVTSGHGVILVLSANGRIKYASKSLRSSWNCSTGLLENVPPTVRKRSWYQHDGALVHYVEDVRQKLNTTYPGRWTGSGGSIARPFRSPHPTPTDLFSRRDTYPRLSKISCQDFRQLWQWSMPTC